MHAKSLPAHVRAIRRRDTSMGGAAKILDWLCRYRETVPVFDRAQGAERDLDSLRVVPADVRVNSLDELLNEGSPPVARIEQLFLQPPKETFTGCVIGRTPLRDIERTASRRASVRAIQASDSARRELNESQAVRHCWSPSRWQHPAWYLRAQHLAGCRSSSSRRDHRSSRS
jgi:hypothetical protein